MSTFIKSLFWPNGGGGHKECDKSRGFTLVELLVVIAIISILATLLLLQLGVARAKARDAKRIADVNQVRSALELYFDDNGGYLGTNVMTGLSPTYLINIPRDPLKTTCGDTYDGVLSGSAACYGYGADVAASPTKFQIWAELEQKNTNALNNDTDFTAAQISGWLVGAARAGNGPLGQNNEVCTSATTIDCIYDSGQP